MPAVPKERRNSTRLEKKYQVFCRTPERSGVGESRDINEKGIRIVTNMEMRVGDLLEVRIVPANEIFSFTSESKVVWVKESNNAPSAERFDIGLQFLTGLKDFAADQLVGSHERLSQRQSIIINAAQKPCYLAICNFESYPKWQQTIKEVNVVERAPDRRPVVVDFAMEALIKKIHFINRYEYFDKDFILSWKTAGGDIKINEGSYVFQRLREDRTNAIFSAYIELGFYAPRRIVDYMSNITMRKSVMALKDVVEKGIIK